jgi:hypothetical protein
MLFEGVEERAKENQSFERVPILFTTPGNHIVRFLKDKNLEVNSHFVKGKYTILCLGDDCPVCSNNKKIISQEPKNFRQIPGYSPRTTKYIYNIVDKTMVKVCTSCGVETKKLGSSDFPANCSGCNTFITEVRPINSNKVKLFVFGQALAISLAGVERTVLGSDQLPLGINNFDLVIHVSGTGKDKKTTPVPLTGATLPDVVVTDSMLHDPSKGIIALIAGEVTDLLRGVSLSDIFKARKPHTDPATEKVTPVVEQEQSVDDIIKGLFADD